MVHWDLEIVAFTDREKCYTGGHYRILFIVQLCDIMSLNISHLGKSPHEKL